MKTCETKGDFQALALDNGKIMREFQNRSIEDKISEQYMSIKL